MGERKVSRYEVEIATSVDPELVERAMRSISNDLAYHLRTHGDSQAHTRTTRVARARVHEAKPQHPTQRPDEPHL